MKSMKILFVLRQFNRQKYDAVTDQAWNMARNLTANGSAQCVVAAGRSGDEAAMEVAGNVQIRRFQGESCGFLPRIFSKKCIRSADSGKLPGLELFLDKNQFDLVHVMCSGRLCQQAAEAARRRNIPYIVSCQSENFRIFDAVNMSRSTGALSSFQSVLRSYGDALENASMIFCGDHTVRRQLAERLGDRKLVHWEPGVNWENYAKPAGVGFREFYQLPKSRSIILSVGRMCRNHNQKMLLDTLSVLRSKNFNCQLVVIGYAAEADYLAEFKKQTSALGLEAFVTYIPGLPSGDELFKAAYQSASLVLLPARYDVSGSAVLEAWSSGVPVAVSPAGCGGDLVIDGENGRVANPGDFQNWIAVCGELLDERNRSQLEKMRGAGISLARSFSWDKRIVRLLEIYQNCIKNI